MKILFTPSQRSSVLSQIFIIFSALKGRSTKPPTTDQPRWSVVGAGGGLLVMWSVIDALHFYWSVVDFYFREWSVSWCLHPGGGGAFFKLAK